MSSGKEFKAAFKKAADWGVPVTVGASDALLLTSERITRSREHLPDDSAGQPFHAAADQGLITCGGDISAYLRYQGLETLLAMALGQAGVPVQQDETSAWLHTLAAAPDVDGLFGTLVFYKGFSVHQYAGCKVDGFTIEGSAGQPLTVSFNLICDDLSINTDSGANTAAALAALAAPPAGNRVLFRQGRFLINDAAAGALSESDAVAPSRFSLSFKRGLAGDHLAGSDTIAEPLSAGFPELSLSLEFPTYTSDTFLHDLGSDVHKKLMISFTGSEIESGQHYRLELVMPQVVLTNVEAAVSGAGKITHPVTASLLAADTPPAGMDGVTAPLVMRLTNTNQNDPLA